jgi:hypothetical protein
MTKARTLADNFAADINAVTAGTGITGGGTSGTVTVTNSMATAIDAKGDLVVGTGADTFSRLAVASTAGYLLSVDSAESTGLKWAAPAGGGKVLQVVGATAATATTSTSTSFADTTLSASITPTASNSKVLVLISQNGVGRSAAGNAQSGTGVKLFRGATELMVLNGHYGYTNTLLVFFGGSVTANYLDSPNTTSSTTYKTQFCAPGTSSTGYVQEGGAISTITLIEIGA